VTYLSAAASNSASIEAQALEAGMKRGGAAKGELVLAIFELANCFRNGWGVAKDPVAARQYYETAANLGDTDAMNEAAWCYLEGVGGKKDKVQSDPSSLGFCVLLCQMSPRCWICLVFRSPICCVPEMSITNRNLLSAIVRSHYSSHRAATLFPLAQHHFQFFGTLHHRV